MQSKNISRAHIFVACIIICFLLATFTPILTYTNGWNPGLYPLTITFFILFVVSIFKYYGALKAELAQILNTHVPNKYPTWEQYCMAISRQMALAEDTRPTGLSAKICLHVMTHSGSNKNGRSKSYVTIEQHDGEDVCDMILTYDTSEDDYNIPRVNVFTGIPHNTLTNAIFRAQTDVLRTSGYL